MTKTTTDKISHHCGQAAEFQVVRCYEGDGWRVLQNLFKSAAGEIDFVLRRSNTVKLVEVKLARTSLPHRGLACGRFESINNPPKVCC